jgi:hypothetical protein
MKKWIPICGLMFLASPAMAQTAPQKSYVLSAPLVEEIVARLSTNGLIAMLQAEAQHQPPPVSCPEPIPPEPPALENK